MFWTLCLVVFSLFTYFFLVKPYQHWPKLGVPSYTTWEILKLYRDGFMRKLSAAESVKKLYDDFPGTRYSGSYQLHKPVLVVRDPGLIKQMTVKDFDHFVDHFQTVLIDDDEPLLQKNLVSLKGDKWRHMRSTLSPSFTSSKMKCMFGLMSDCAQQFIEHFDAQDPKPEGMEIKEAFSKLTIDVIASTAFGISCNSLKDPDNEFYQMGRKVMNPSFGFWQILKIVFFMVFPSLRKVFGFKLMDVEVASFFRKLVKENIEAREKGGIIRMDMIHLLMEARKGRTKTEKVTSVDIASASGLLMVEETPAEEAHINEQLSVDDITAQAMLFFFAAFENVATLMSCMAYELAINTDVQEKLQAEVDDVRHNCAGRLTYEALSKMKYMDMVVLETLRKWPGALLLDRLCVKPYTIQPVKPGEKPLQVHQGDIVFFPTFGIHRDPQFYPEPDRFDPERFSKDNKTTLNPYAFVPFGAGPRICIGSRFALLEAKLVFFQILAKFDVVVVEKTPISFKFSRTMVQLYPEGGFWVGLKRRRA